MKTFMKFLVCLLMITCWRCEAQYTNAAPTNISVLPVITNWNAFFLTNSFSTNVNGTFVRNPTNGYEFDYAGSNGLNGIVGSVKGIALCVSNVAGSTNVLAVLNVVSNSGAGVFWAMTNLNANPEFMQSAQTYSSTSSGPYPTNSAGYIVPWPSSFPPYPSFGPVGGTTFGNAWITNTLQTNFYTTNLPGSIIPTLP